MSNLLHKYKIEQYTVNVYKNIAYRKNNFKCSICETPKIRSYVTTQKSYLTVLCKLCDECTDKYKFLSEDYDLIKKNLLILKMKENLR